ncbi:hypothetical protein WME77_14190 [Sorangium sp. So ce764]
MSFYSCYPLTIRWMSCLALISPGLMTMPRTGDHNAFTDIPQVLDEHLLADARQATLQLAEAAGAVIVQLPQDQRFPLA